MDSDRRGDPGASGSVLTGETDHRDCSRFEQLVGELVREAARIRHDQVDQRMGHWLQRIGTVLRMERCSLARYLSDEERLEVTHSWAKEPGTTRRQWRIKWEWTTLVHQLRQGRTIISDSTERLPSAARSLRVPVGPRPLLGAAVPMIAADEVVGGLFCDVSADAQEWSAGTQSRIEIITAILAQTLALHRTRPSLEEARERARSKETALVEVLTHLDRERARYRSELMQNVRVSLEPTLRKLHAGDGSLNQRDIEMFEHALKSLAGRECDRFRENLEQLSGREIDVCELIQQRKTSKEIAADLNLSLETVHKHRASIRRKLSLAHKGIDLATYLRTKGMRIVK